MQSKKHSLLEAVLNTASGFVISFIVGLVAFPLYGFQPTLAQNFGLVTIFTVTSIIRSYAWRRAFNWYQHGRT